MANSAPRYFAVARAAEQKVGLHRPLALDVHYLPLLERIRMTKLPVDSFGHLDAIGRSISFHSCRGIHGVPPDIVKQLALAEHAGHCRAGVNTDSHGELLTDLVAQIADCL